MKVYFDESYPIPSDVMILGALFFTDAGNKFVHDEYEKILRKYKIKGEMKYNLLRSPNRLNAAIEATRLFIDSTDPYFRAYVLPYDARSLQNLKGDLNQQRTGLYCHSAKNLIIDNLVQGEKVDVFMDKESRIETTDFKKNMLTVKGSNGNKVNSVSFVDSSNISTHLVQLCDLLTGAILQNLYPLNTQSGYYKRKYGEYFKKELGITIFTNVKKIRTARKKVVINFLEVPNFAAMHSLIAKRKKSKSRS